MAGARLPIPGEDKGTWGDILNTFLSVELNTDGTLKTDGSLATKADANTVVSLNSAQTITGVKQFNASPLVPVPTTAFEVANKQYVDSITSGSVVADDLAEVAVSGLYNDLTGRPTLSGVATSGSYDDLSNKPSIPDVSTLVDTSDSRLTNTRTPSDDSVSTAKLQDASITEPKLAVSNSPSTGNVLAWDGSALEWQSLASAPVQSVNGHTGTVTVTKSDVGLGNTDNTSDANKPVSTAAQTAIDAKLAKSGDTMTGLLTLSGAPSNPNHAATKAYVDSAASGGQNLVIGTTAPTPAAGVKVLWLDTSSGNITLNLVTGE